MRFALVPLLAHAILRNCETLRLVIDASGQVQPWQSGNVPVHITLQTIGLRRPWLLSVAGTSRASNCFFCCLNKSLDIFRLGILRATLPLQYMYVCPLPAWQARLHNLSFMFRSPPVWAWTKKANATDFQCWVLIFGLLFDWFVFFPKFVLGDFRFFLAGWIPPRKVPIQFRIWLKRIK